MTELKTILAHLKDDPDTPYWMIKALEAYIEKMEAILQKLSEKEKEELRRYQKQIEDKKKNDDENWRWLLLLMMLFLFLDPERPRYDFTLERPQDDFTLRPVRGPRCK